MAERALGSRAAATEWIRVWGYEVPGYEREGWRFSHARAGGPSEQLCGPDYRDCWMMRELSHG